MDCIGKELFNFNYITFWIQCIFKLFYLIDLFKKYIKDDHESFCRFNKYCKYIYINYISTYIVRYLTL